MLFLTLYPVQSIEYPGGVDSTYYQYLAMIISVVFVLSLPVLINKRPSS